MSADSDLQKKSPDRVSYSFGRKLNLGNYESADFHISYSTDVEAGETKKDAMARAVKFVELRAAEAQNRITNGS